MEGSLYNFGFGLFGGCNNPSAFPIKTSNFQVLKRCKPSLEIFPNPVAHEVRHGQPLLAAATFSCGRKVILNCTIPAATQGILGFHAPGVETCAS